MSQDTFKLFAERSFTLLNGSPYILLDISVISLDLDFATVAKPVKLIEELVRRPLDRLGFLVKIHDVEVNRTLAKLRSD